VLQWDQSPALPDFVLIRPSGAPCCVISTIRRDTEKCRYCRSLIEGWPCLQVGKALVKEGRDVDAHLFIYITFYCTGYELKKY
ncbi:hypothetical protein Gohar_013118, partial [Gossypium harknessii]|nr:hypothetical protein [Gossypium harknessii]